LIVLSADHGGPEAPGYLQSLGIPAGYVSPDEWDKDPVIARIKSKFGIGGQLVQGYDHPYLYLTNDITRNPRIDLAALETMIAKELVAFPGVSYAIPTGSHPEAFGSDAYANGQYLPPSVTPYSFEERTGFERERLYMLGELHKANVSNLLVAATDVHYASQMRHERDFDGDGDTLNPVVLYAEGNIFNFAYMETKPVDGEMGFITDVRDETGKVRPGSVLEIPPR